jgi:hypothetical protein
MDIKLYKIKRAWTNSRDNKRIEVDGHEPTMPLPNITELFYPKDGHIYPEKRDLSILTGIFERILTYNKSITVVVQEEYVDIVYRDIYYEYYASKHFNIGRFCKRVFIFKGDVVDKIIYDKNPSIERCFIGVMVLKPTLRGQIGRSLFNPKYFFSKIESKKLYIRTTKYEITFMNTPIFVRAFPYMSQDTEDITCSEVSILNLMDYFSNNYNNYRFMLPSEIHSIAQKHYHQRVLPSTGMQRKIISKILLESGFFPLQYVAGFSPYVEGKLHQSELKRVLHYYVESGIPVDLVHKKKGDAVSHSIIVIGHGESDMHAMLNSVYSISPNDFCDGKGNDDRFYLANTANAHKKYIVMDDSDIPYSSRSLEAEEHRLSIKNYNHAQKATTEIADVESLTVPLYKRTFLPAEDAFKFAREILRGALAKENIFAKYDSKTNNEVDRKLGSKNNPLILRLFLAPTKNFLKYRFENTERNLMIAKVYTATPFPKSIWVCELYDQEGYGALNAIGELIIDSTAASSSVISKSVIIQHYPYFFSSVNRDGEIPKELSLFFANPDISQGETAENLGIIYKELPD